MQRLNTIEGRQPTGARHEVGVDDLFFSTTDEQGVITEVNSVFIRLSRFSRDQLTFAPHNIIRHPDMPQGAFKLMWDTLKEGQPFCAYVDNLAADGSTYRVFATVTPIPGGYLSVRARPMVDGLISAAFSLYGAVRPIEINARGEGLSARKSAEVGTEHLAALLAQAGFASYQEFIWHALPAEVEARTTQARFLTVRSDATGPLCNLSVDTVELVSQLRTLSGRQVDLLKVAGALVNAVPELQKGLTDAEQTAEQIRHTAEGNPELAPILLSVTVWAAMMDEIRSLTMALIEELEKLRTSVSYTNFRIALARLHAEAVGQFVEELIDGIDAEHSGEAAIDMLVGALSEGMKLTSTQSCETAELATQVQESVKGLADLLALPRDLIVNWQTMIEGRADEALGRLVPVVADQLDGSQAAVELLTSLAGEVSAIAVPPDLSEVFQLLGQIGVSVEQYVGPTTQPRRGL